MIKQIILINSNYFTDIKTLQNTIIETFDVGTEVSRQISEIG